MKKVLSMLLVCMFCISLSACGNSGENSGVASKYVGTYICNEETCYEEISAFKLLSSGKVVWFEDGVEVFYESDFNIITDSGNVNSGEWTFENGQLYIFFEYNNGSVHNRAFIFNVFEDGILSLGENTYSKAQ